MRIIIKEDYEEMSKCAAEIIARQIKNKPNLVLGLATGSTPLGLYKELISMHKEEDLDFSHITTFNLDEYYGITPSHPQSYHYFMDENLFKKINISPEKVHIPKGQVKIDEVKKYCLDYEKMIKDAGRIDIQILGIGGDGHIAFNEPGSSLSSRTRLVSLDEQTSKDNSRFFNSLDEVPKAALTMGVGTILEAKMCILLVNGAKKAAILQQAIEGPITSQITASALQLHPNTIVILDKEASSKLKKKDYYLYTEKIFRELKK